MTSARARAGRARKLVHRFAPSPYPPPSRVAMACDELEDPPAQHVTGEREQESAAWRRGAAHLEGQTCITKGVS